MGRFADLRPDTGQRMAFWNFYKRNVWELLTDVNNDMMANTGMFFEDYETQKEPYPRLTTPNLTLVFEKPKRMNCTVGMGPSPREGLMRVRVSLRGTVVNFKHVPPDKLESTLRAMLVWMLDAGMAQAWFLPDAAL